MGHYVLDSHDYRPSRKVVSWSQQLGAAAVVPRPGRPTGSRVQLFVLGAQLSPAQFAFLRESPWTRDGVLGKSWIKVGKRAKRDFPTICQRSKAKGFLAFLYCFF